MLLPDHQAALDVLTLTYEGTPHGSALLALLLELARAVEYAAFQYTRERTEQRYNEMHAAAWVRAGSVGRERERWITHHSLMKKS